MKRNKIVLGLSLVGLCLGLSGCRTDMWVQQRVEAQDSSEFYTLIEPVNGPNGTVYGLGSRPIPPNTIPYRGLQDPNDSFLTGKDAKGDLLKTLPPQVKLSRELLNLGEQKFNSFCLPCHGRAGDGKGMIALRGQWPRPVPALVDDRLKAQPIGYFYGVATNGFGIMYGYGKRMTPEERWAVAAYVRVLQLSQNANPKDLPDEDMLRVIESAQSASVSQQVANRGGMR